MNRNRRVVHVELLSIHGEKAYNYVKEALKSEKMEWLYVYKVIIILCKKDYLINLDEVVGIL